MGRTKDEKFIIRLYEMAKKEGDLEYIFNRYDVGRSIGLHERGIDTICVLLMQANFVKKAGKEEIHLTKHGEQLVLTLLEER